VVAFYGIKCDDNQAGKLINESIARIEWTLKEVLPRGWDLGPQAEDPEMSRRLSGGQSKISA
jgi:hypothetical protein